MSAWEKLAELEERQIYFGTSSWKYPGWKGLIFHKEYSSDKEFNEECLEEYATHFSAVGVDHTYYAWPTPRLFERYVAQTPPGFLFSLKATERLTVFQYPNLKRYGKEAGTRNESFLDPAVFLDNFLAPLEPFKERLGPIMFEFSQFYPGTIGSGSEFVERLDRFFEGISVAAGFHYAVELRNQNWLKAPYFELLSRRKVGHVFNSWTRMPSIGEQLDAAEGHALPYYVARLLLEPGVKYEEAVEAFSPYDRLQHELPQVRADAARLVTKAIRLGVPAFVFVNNRCEGCAPKTIEKILEGVSLLPSLKGSGHLL